MTARLPLLLVCCTLFPFAGRAQTLAHRYEFNGNLNDSAGSVALTNPNGGTVNSGTYSFSAGQGLGFVGGLGLQTTYTIAIRFKFENVTNYGKFIDFKDRTSENGAYVVTSTFLFFGTSGTQTGSITANTYADFILTRDSSGAVKAYDGASSTPIFSFTDGSSIAVANGSGSATNSVLWFFRDDTGNTDNASGEVDRILIYDGALSGAATVGVLSAIPEPSTYAAIFGAAALGLAAWRRRRGPAPSAAAAQ
jgi:hypothetical protein